MTIEGDGGAAGGAGGAGDGGAGGGAEKAFYEAFQDKVLATSPSVQACKTPEELASRFVNLEKRFGIDPNRRLDLPADPADKDGMRAVWAKLGMPEKPDGYGLALDDKAPDHDKALLGRFTAKAHELGLPVDQAKGVMEWWAAENNAAKEASAEAFKANAAAGTEALKKDWGGAYDTKVKEIGAAIAKYGDEALVKELDAGGLGNYPNLARMLAKMMDRMAEPGGGDDPLNVGGGADRPLTPLQAGAAVKTLEGDPVKGKALNDAMHPQHKAVVAERSRLLRIAAGGAG